MQISAYHHRRFKWDGTAVALAGYILQENKGSLQAGQCCGWQCSAMFYMNKTFLALSVHPCTPLDVVVKKQMSALAKFTLFAAATSWILFNRISCSWKQLRWLQQHGNACDMNTNIPQMCTLLCLVRPKRHCKDPVNKSRDPVLDFCLRGLNLNATDWFPLNLLCTCTPPRQFDGGCLIDDCYQQASSGKEK